MSKEVQPIFLLGRTQGRRFSFYFFPSRFILHNRQMTFEPAFSEPQSHWSSLPLPTTPGQTDGARRELGNVKDPPHPGRTRPHPRTKSFHKSAIPTNWGRKRRSPGSILPRTVWGPIPGFVEPTPPGEDKVPSPDHNPSIHLHLQQTGDEIGDPRVDTATHGVETPNPRADH